MNLCHIESKPLAVPFSFIYGCPLLAWNNHVDNAFLRRDAISSTTFLNSLDHPMMNRLPVVCDVFFGST